MTTKVRYAGYDPNEDDFSDIVLSSDNRYDFGKNMAARRVSVDPAIVRIIRAAGLSYRVVGQLVAEVYCRSMPYRNETMSQVMRKAKR